MVMALISQHHTALRGFGSVYQEGHGAEVSTAPVSWFHGGRKLLIILLTRRVTEWEEMNQIVLMRPSLKKSFKSTSKYSFRGIFLPYLYLNSPLSFTPHSHWGRSQNGGVRHFSREIRTVNWWWKETFAWHLIDSLSPCEVVVSLTPFHRWRNWG